MIEQSVKVCLVCRRRAKNPERKQPSTLVCILAAEYIWEFAKMGGPSKQIPRYYDSCYEDP